MDTVDIKQTLIQSQYECNEDQVKDIPIKAGQKIITKDSKKIYYDTSEGKRISIGNGSASGNTGILKRTELSFHLVERTTTIDLTSISIPDIFIVDVSINGLKINPQDYNFSEHFASMTFSEELKASMNEPMDVLILLSYIG